VILGYFKQHVISMECFILKLHLILFPQDFVLEVFAKLSQSDCILVYNFHYDSTVRDSCYNCHIRAIVQNIYE